MAEWLYEAGIGEARAALVERGRIVRAAIEVDDGVHVGDVLDMRLVERLANATRGVVRDDRGVEALIDPLPRSAVEGASYRVRIDREAIAEPGRAKRARGTITDAALARGPDLRARVAAASVRTLSPHDPDALEEAGWSEFLDGAQRGEVDFAGGALRITPTPAMTLIDVDGWLPAADLAVAGTRAAAAAIIAFDIGGSIGIDLPTVTGKAARHVVDAALAEALPGIARTAINGFGFVQVVRPRPRASLIEHLRGDPAGHAARALLRRAERSGVVGATVVRASPAVAAAILPEWLARLGRTLGGAVTLRADASLGMDGGDVTRDR